MTLRLSEATHVMSLLKTVVTAVMAVAIGACTITPGFPCEPHLPEGLEPEASETLAILFLQRPDSFRWWRCMARVNHWPEAQYRLGRAYELAIGTEKDLGAAQYWYDEAGWPRSGISLQSVPNRGGGFETIIPRYGEPTPGHPLAQYRMGLIQLEKERPALARLWLKMAADQGHRYAEAKLKELESASAETEDRRKLERTDGDN